MRVICASAYLGLPLVHWFETLWNPVISVGPNKYLEVQFVTESVLASFDINISANEDHGGFYLDVGLLGFTLMIAIYDNRHWNDLTGNYID